MYTHVTAEPRSIAERVVCAESAHGRLFSYMFMLLGHTKGGAVHGSQVSPSGVTREVTQFSLALMKKFYRIGCVSV